MELKSEVRTVVCSESKSAAQGRLVALLDCPSRARLNEMLDDFPNILEEMKSRCLESEFKN